MRWWFHYLLFRLLNMGDAHKIGACVYVCVYVCSLFTFEFAEFAKRKWSDQEKNEIIENRD